MTTTETSGEWQGGDDYLDPVWRWEKGTGLREIADADYLNAMEQKLAQVLASLVYIADRVRDEHLEDVANKAIDAIAKLQEGK